METKDKQPTTLSGQVSKFDNGRGWGFIRIDGWKYDIFVHYRSIVGDGFRSLFPGERVTCEVVASPKGEQAVNVRVVE